ncbi:MAG: aminodeoxychorismate lyase [Nitrospiraceae bacterium]|nr:MAG: aminodeoxychorismate lyase [Nitrospiraceae bacterium]
MIYLNNRIVPKSRARVSVYDHGFLYGDGIYETLRVYQGTVFQLDEHIARLFRSAAMIQLTIPKTHEAIKRALSKTLKANRHKDAVVRITISRGEGPTGLDPALCSSPTFVIMSHAFKPYPAKHYQQGVKIAIVRTRRNYNGALNAQIKSLNFLNNVLARIEAKKEGALEGIMLNYRSFIAEGTVSNVFFVRDGVLCTPSVNAGILDGITRGLLVECAKELRLTVREGMFRKDALMSADEVFISNTTMEVMPVSSVNDTKISSRPGSITKKLRRAYRKKVNAYIKKAERSNE